MLPGARVNAVGKGGRLYAVGERVRGSAQVVARALRAGDLWERVRAAGGAYGATCRLAPESGRFTFASRRDPHVGATLRAYDAAARALAAGPPPARGAVERAVVGAVGDLDRPLAPEQAGFVAMRRFLVGDSLARRQRRRDEALATTAGDFAEFGERLVEMRAHAVVFGSREALDAANAEGADLEIAPAF